MTFNHTSYRNSHGMDPRGRGSWAFSTVDPDRPIGLDNYTNHLIWVHGTFTDAKRAARCLVRDPAIFLRNVGGDYGWNPTLAYPGSASRVRISEFAANELSYGVDVLWVAP